MPAPVDQPIRLARPSAEQGCNGDLRDGPGDRNGADREQVLQGKVQADAEHEQNDADLCELVGKRLIGDEAGRMGTDQHTCQEISKQW